MTTMVPPSTADLFGAAVKRREDARFITGKGLYTDDIKLHGTSYAAFVRSPYAHARIRGIDAAAAKARPGVVAVFTGKDLEGSVQPLPLAWLLPNMKIGPRRALPPDEARHVGEAARAPLPPPPDAGRAGPPPPPGALR